MATYGWGERIRQGVLPLALSEGDRLVLDAGADLALVLSGAVALSETGGDDVLWTGAPETPLVFAERDCRGVDVVALTEVALITMSLPACQRLVACSGRFRQLFHKATEARIRALHASRAMAPPRPAMLH